MAEDIRPDIDRARKGDREAFGRLVRKYQRRVYLTAYRITGNDEDANDMAQEAFIRAYRGMARFDNRSNFFTWLYRIVVNVCLNHLRSRKRRAALPLESVTLPPDLQQAAGDDPDRVLEAKRKLRQVQEALDDLGESLRATVVLVVMEGMSYADAAQVLECSEGTVGWRMHEARRKLKERLGHHLAGATAEGQG